MPLVDWDKIITNRYIQRILEKSHTFVAVLVTSLVFSVAAFLVYIVSDAVFDAILGPATKLAFYILLPFLWLDALVLIDIFAVQLDPVDKLLK
jgi:hypothetical protein